MEYEIHTNNDELTHWGIKGMRWGIRRYQNKDGSLTPAGKAKLRAEQAKVREQEAINKKRKSVQASFDRLEARKKAAADEKAALDDAERTKLGKGKKSIGSNSGKKPEHEAPKPEKDEKAEKPAKKTLKDMSDEELVSAINRARLEDTYRQLRPEAEKHPLMKKMVNDVAIPAATTAGKQFLQNAITKAGENLLNKGKSDPNTLEALKKTWETLDYKQRIDKIKNPDKYLSEEDKTKRADRKYKAEDRAAQWEGYENVKERAKAKKNDTNTNTRRDTDDGSSSKQEDTTTKTSEKTKQKVYEGTVEGVGTSSKAASQGKKWTNNSKVVDADYWEVVDDDNVSSGRSYVSNYLALPMPSLLPAPKDDD